MIRAPSVFAVSKEALVNLLRTLTDWVRPVHLFYLDNDRKKTWL